MEEKNIFDVLDFLNKEGYTNARITFWNQSTEWSLSELFGLVNTNNSTRLPKGRYLFVWPIEDTDDAKKLYNILTPCADITISYDERVLIYPIPNVVWG